MEQLQLDPKQQEAIDACCNVENRVVGITGPAGTGKTTILRIAYNQLQAHGYRVALCAPTGKAAKRIFEATGIDASTVHRFLEYSHPGDPDPKTGKPVGYAFPKRTRSNPVEFDVVFVDEYMMVNEDVHRSLFDALPPGCVVRVFGDINQLAPIEEDKRLANAPTNFQKILDNPKFVSVVLEKVFRQGEDSGILLNAHNLLRSRMPTRNEQWSMHITDGPVDALREYILEQQFEHDIDYSSIENQIIVPQNTSWVGTVKLNAMIQNLFHNNLDDGSMWIPRKDWAMGLNPKSPTGDMIKGDKGGMLRLFVSDKVIYTSNQYDLGVFNGETGRIIEINDDSGEIVVDFGDREQSIPPVLMVQNRHGGFSSIDPRKDLDLAYAITTHKTQGSEYRRIIYILNKSNLYMINRRNFYTACTRAREHVHVIADQKGLSQAVFKKDQAIAR